MSNIIKEIQQSLNEVPPLKIDIKPVMPTAPAPDPLGGIKPVALPEAVPQPLQAPQPSAPIQAIPSTGSPVPEVPEVDALSYGDTISRMSAQSAADIQKTIQSAGTPKPNDVQNQLLGGNTPVQIDPKLSSQANPFAGNTPENAQERLAFEPPVLANGLANPFSDPDARAAVAAGISREEYLAYVRDIRKKGDESNTFGTPITPSSGYADEYGNVQGATSNTTTSFAGLTAEQIRRKMSERSRYLSARRNFNTSFLPLAGSENRNELETLFAALAFPANLFKGIGLDVLRPAAAVVSGGANIEEIKKAYEAMRPTKGGTFTGAAVLGQDFSSLAIADQKGAAFNPLAAVRDDKNLFQIALGFGLDILADPLNNEKLEKLLFRPMRMFQRTGNAAVIAKADEVVQLALPPSRPQLMLAPAKDLPSLPTARSALVTDPPKPIITPPPEVTRVLITPEPRLVTTIAGDTPPVRPQPDRVPTPNTPPRLDVPTSARQLEAPREIVIEREVARNNELAVYQPSEVVFPEARQPFVPIPDSRAIVPVPEVNMYNNVTALFNDSPDLPVVQRFMRDVVEQKPFEQIPDARSLVVVQNPVLREVAEFAQTGDLTPNVAALQGATVDEIADIVADRLELIDDTPLVVPKLVAQPIEVPQLEFDVTRQLPKQPASRLPDFNSDLIVSTDSISTPVNKNLDQNLVEKLAQEMVSAADTVRPVIVERVSPVEFKVVSGELQYAAAVRAAELDPNFELRSVVVQKGTPQYEAIVKQEAAYKEIAKLSEDATLVSTARDTPTYTGTKTERALGTTTGGRTLDLDAITTQRGGAYSTEAVQRMADSMLETGANVRPIVVRRTSPTEFELIRGNLEYLAAKRAAEMNPQFSEVRALIVDSANEAAVLRQLDILDEGIPVSTTMPVVVDNAPFTSLSDLIDNARDGGIESLSEVSKWAQKGDFVTKLKDIPAAVDDLGIDALNTPSLMKVVKGRAGKLSNKVVKEVSESLVKVDINKAEDISKSLFDALWRKSTDDQKQTILSSIPPKRLNELGLERVETKVVPPTLPTLAHIQSKISSYKLTNLERAVDIYTSQSNELNALVRKGEASYSKELISEIWNNLESVGTLYRGVSLSPKQLKLKVGEFYNDRAISSYSLDLSVSENYFLKDGGTLFVTDSKGYRVIDSSVSEEAEVLIPPNASQKILSIEESVSSSGKKYSIVTLGEITSKQPVPVKSKTVRAKPAEVPQEIIDTVDGYHVVNDSQLTMEELYVANLMEQGVSRRDAIGRRNHPLLEWASTGTLREREFKIFLDSKELSTATPRERAWSSAMLKRVWEVATPEQKARIMMMYDARTLEQLGLERIARSNVIDDHLPLEKEFDTPC